MKAETRLTVILINEENRMNLPKLEDKYFDNGK